MDLCEFVKFQILRESTSSKGCQLFVKLCEKDERTFKVHKVRLWLPQGIALVFFVAVKK